MIGKTHAHLMRDIQGYVEILKKSIESKFGFNDFFIESTYKDSIGRTLPCYLLTKKGCDMVANKMTGEKGVLFTAAYVTAFEAMRQHIQSDGVTIRDSIGREQHPTIINESGLYSLVLSSKLPTARKFRR